jgi:NitT/TauT family transport system permease protein/sulfonate transport system permease protein
MSEALSKSLPKPLPQAVPKSRRGSSSATLVAYVQGALLPIALLAAWQIAAGGGHLPEYLPSPATILRAFAELFHSGDLVNAFWASSYRVYSGFALGAGAGVLLGLGAGLWTPLRNFFDPLVSFLYPIPKIAFLPVFLLLFGLGHGLIIAIIALSVFFPVFIASRYSVLSINPRFAWAARNMGASEAVIFFRVILPASAPQTFVGLRVGLSMAFVLLFSSELISAQAGFGYLITQGDEAGRYDIMFAGIVAFAVLGFISDRILMIVRRRVLRGQSIGTSEGQQ